MSKRVLVKVCTGDGDGCGFVVRVTNPKADERNVAANTPANDCPTCGLDRYYDYYTLREIDRANGLY